MKKQPKAVYIIENGGYTELTYEEFCRREQNLPLYADKLFLPLYGRLMEVSKEDYAEFYRAKRRQKTLPSREDSLDRLMEDNAQQFLDSHESVEDIVIQKISAEKLHMALLRLPKKDQELIYALFYEEKTERVYAEQIGVSPSTVHRRREKIIKKLKNYLK